MMHRILIADDDTSLRLLVTTTLTDDEIVLIEAQDGIQALSLARRDRPDLIVLDVAMPGLTGLEVCSALKDDPATSGIPVIMLTARSQQIDRERGLAARADAYLTKPFSPLQLLRLVEHVLRSPAPARTV
jgi:DNA-binding response OmpR family regulator